MKICHHRVVKNMENEKVSLKACEKYRENCDISNFEKFIIYCYYYYYYYYYRYYARVSFRLQYYYDILLQIVRVLRTFSESLLISESLSRA